MIELTVSTSSVGAVWPPEESSNNRLKGFYNQILSNAREVDEFVSQFNQHQEVVEAHPNIDRLSIRVVSSVGSLAALEGLGINIEGAMPLRGANDVIVAYTAWNDESRRLPEEKLREHRDLLNYAVSLAPSSDSAIDHLTSLGFEPKVIDQGTPNDEKDSMSGKFVSLYSVFGYTQDEVTELLLNPANTIAYIEDEDGVVSTCMAERAEVDVKNFGRITLVELTEAFTLPSRRGEGLYRSISKYLIDRLTEDRDSLDVVYGESNLTMPGVVIAAHKNGRKLSFSDRARFGISHPDFGILQQNFHIQDGQETRAFNDFALSYVPLD